LPVTLRNHAQRFDRSVFRHNFLSLLRSSGIKLDSGQKKVIAKAG
jgi:hypothetical protein